MWYDKEVPGADHAEKLVVDRSPVKKYSPVRMICERRPIISEPAHEQRVTA